MYWTLNIVHILDHLIPQNILPSQDYYCCCSHFIDRETEVGSGYVRCAIFHNRCDWIQAQKVQKCTYTLKLVEETVIMFSGWITSLGSSPVALYII